MIPPKTLAWLCLARADQSSHARHEGARPQRLTAS